ncbi:MAG: hypothetical protein AB7F86_08960 [Bdellovibrionales bacterium]
MSQEEAKLRESLKRLEESSRKIIETSGYTGEVRSIRMLQEMIKEQLRNATASHSTRPIR